MEYKNGEQYPDSTYFAPAEPGSRVTITSVNGKPFDPKADYTVVVNSFQAEGGDTYYALTQGSFVHDTAIVDADALISYVNSLGGVIGKEYAEPQGRIKITGEAAAEPVAPAEPAAPVEPAAPAEPAETVTPAETVVPAEKEETDTSVITDLYRVIAGDTLWKIAKEQLGNGSKWNEIYEANRKTIKNPNLIYIGQELIINK